MFIVEGNIGAGKSTFLTMLQATCPTLKIVQEPVHNWSSERYGKSLLEEFYTKPARWAFTLETFAMLARSLDHVKQQRGVTDNVVMERSIYSGHYCFAFNDLASGYFNEIEWEVYTQWVNFIMYQQCKPPRGFIYLRSNPETCHTRMHKRSRSGEELVSLAYLRNIHEWHEKFLINKAGLDAQLRRVPVLVLDVDEDFQQDPLAFEHLAVKTAAFIEATLPARAYSQSAA